MIVGDYDTQGLADWVTMPNVEAVCTAVGSLLDSGCRRIALIGGTAENACPDADREPLPETTMAGLLDDPDVPRPDAVMCLNDALAIGVIHELQRRGVRVPQDMQVIGFDNVPDAEYCMPGLTTIDPHVDDYARHAVDMLIARIEGSAAVASPVAYSGRGDMRARIGAAPPSALDGRRSAYANRSNLPCPAR